MSASFSARIIAWQKTHGRHDLPWQGTRDPYPIWVSEIMLQQTQVATVIPYFNRFIARFPDVTALAAAPLDEVLRLWSGLGYYSRARNLHAAAQNIVTANGARFPRAFAQIAALPGIGRSTAAAISVFAWGARQAILDGNVKRLLARHAGIRGYPGDRSVSERLWRIAEQRLPRRGVERYTQGLMDHGATVCVRSRPRCPECPVRADCVALRRGWVHSVPGPRPARRRPHRRTVMLVLTRAGEVLLEKRPSTGVWGGMWCLPEIARRADLEAHCLKRFGAHVTEVEALEAVAHAFTHFSLDIRPFRLRVSALVPNGEEPGVVWLPLEEARGAAIPAPVRRILAAL